MGNSEVGHLNLGAGRIVYQDIVRIDKAIKDGAFYSNQTLIASRSRPRRRAGGTLHLFGLTSPGNVHASLEHAYAVCELAKRRGLDRGRLARVPRRARHAAARRRPATCATSAAKLAEIGVGELVVGGRPLLRDGSRQALGAARGRLEDAHARRGDAGRRSGRRRRARLHGGRRRQGADRRVRDAARAQGRRRQGRAPIIKDGDACFFFNFRADRARQLTLALHAGDGDFPHFDRAPRPKLAAFATMTQYDAKVDVPAAFPPQSLNMILGEVLSKHGVSQLRTAETEKYAHVTYFFNGGVEQAFPGEERQLVPSNRDVATYDLAPEMSAAPVTDGVVEALQAGRARRSSWSTTPTPTWSATPACSSRRFSAVETIDAVHRPHRRRRGRQGRRDRLHHRRSRQLRDDDRSRDRAAAHRAHHEPDPVHRRSARRQSGPQAARGRAAGRRGADRPRGDGDRRSRRRWTA